jgi:hypothetical protein
MKNNIVNFLFCLDYTSILFLLGFSGLIINRRNILVMLLSLELTFLVSSLNFIVRCLIMIINRRFFLIYFNKMYFQINNLSNLEKIRECRMLLKFYVSLTTDIISTLSKVYLTLFTQRIYYDILVRNKQYYKIFHNMINVKV